jgi:hypothetical protein
MWESAAEPEAVDMCERDTAGVRAKAGWVLGWVPRVKFVGKDSLRVTCVLSSRVDPMLSTSWGQDQSWSCQVSKLERVVKGRRGSCILHNIPLPLLLGTGGAAQRHMIGRGHSRKVHSTIVPGGLELTPHALLMCCSVASFSRSRPSVLPGNPRSRGGGSIEVPLIYVAAEESCTFLS